MLITQALKQVVKPDVVLAPYDAVAADAGALAEVPWQLVVMDERQRPRASLGKAHQALRDVAAAHRLLLPHTPPSQVRALSFSLSALPLFLLLIMLITA